MMNFAYTKPFNPTKLRAVWWMISHLSYTVLHIHWLRSIYFLDPIKNVYSQTFPKCIHVLFAVRLSLSFLNASPAVADWGRARGVSLASTWVTSNTVISTPYPSKWHKESRGTERKSEQKASFPVSIGTFFQSKCSDRWDLECCDSFSLFYLWKAHQVRCVYI